MRLYPVNGVKIPQRKSNAYSTTGVASMISARERAGSQLAKRGDPTEPATVTINGRLPVMAGRILGMVLREQEQLMLASLLRRVIRVPNLRRETIYDRRQQQQRSMPVA